MQASYNFRSAMRPEPLLRHRGAFCVVSVGELARGSLALQVCSHSTGYRALSCAAASPLV
jgi:hypothetical protein